MIPYVIWSVLYTLSSKRPERIFYDLLTTKSNGTLYYVFVYVQFVLLTPAIEKLAVSKYRAVGLLISPIFLLLSRYIPFFCNIQVNTFLLLALDVSCVGWFSFYYLGYIMRNGYAEGIVMKAEQISRKALFIYVGSLVLQILEGYVWFVAGSNNCGSQAKLTCVLSNSIFCVMVYAFVYCGRSVINKADCLSSDNVVENEKRTHTYAYGSCGGVLINRVTTVRNHIREWLISVGDCSFGIFLSHIMIIKVIGKIFSSYNTLPYGINSLTILLASWLCVLAAHRILGKYAGWIGC